ncbi:hypothetical protein [Yersinia rohdei]|uniref:hypothetical protein n=1 Tax=Yersinia rohdei TaxID=29485 RepID=UPI0001A553B7|nr:hypothetical protein [Yersinia rohdei]EEQ01653.1 Type III secretion system apparatus protein [Yersinia rohdei ATCC 43380]OWF80284.1 type III secretion protein [Yersinia rohdei]
MSRLLALRQRKERRLRQQLVCLRLKYQQQEQQLVNIRHQRQQLCVHLQQLIQWRGKLTPEEADKQRVLQHEMYQTERELQKSLGELTSQRLQQLADIESQQALLRINQREQEKLRMLIKNEPNQY